VSYGLVQETYNKSLTTSEVKMFVQNVQNVEFLTVEAIVTGSPLASFTTKIKGHTASALFDIFSSSADYTNPKGILRGSGCDMTTLADTGWIMLDVRGLIEISINASSTGTSDLTLRVGG